MTGREVVFVDANTIWHRMIAEAVGRMRDTIALLPQQGLFPIARAYNRGSGLRTIVLRLVPGWASRTAVIGQRQIAVAVRKAARMLHGEPTIVLTSPKYRLLARILEGYFPLVYYCADDYREYEGWGGNEMADAEAEIVSRVDLSVFVSEALKARAITEYGLKEAATLVSPNATEPRFLANSMEQWPSRLTKVARPIFGVLGGLSQRLDLNLIRSVADLDFVGTFAIVGPVDEFTWQSKLGLCGHPKVLITGWLPHAEMHLYARALDAALVPYARTAINYFCSPMRLYDHLAAGTPIYATDACDQINGYIHQSILVAEAMRLPSRIAHEFRLPIEVSPIDSSDKSTLLWAHRADRLLAAIDTL